MKPPFITLLAGLLCLAPCATHAASVMLLSYTAPSGNEYAPVVFTNLINASSMGLGSSLAGIEPGGSVPESIFLVASESATSPAQAVLNAQFMQFVVTANPGFWFIPDTLSFDVARGGASSTRGWALTSSLNNFATVIASSDVAAVQPTFQNVSINLNSSATLTSAVFRLYLYTPDVNTGLFFDNITVSGTAVPEWSTLSLCPFALVPLLRRRRTPIKGAAKS
jgi:hypothetical protein